LGKFFVDNTTMMGKFKETFIGAGKAVGKMA